MTLGTGHFKVNHHIPPETFIVDIPDSAMIRVREFRQELTKKNSFNDTVASRKTAWVP
ncbi:MAG: hypothetical protein OXN17_15620 [Candidatus Poribacteria bacterium]|nr:hypothetical protein [Candidatus Poribacteria bacterium]